MRQLKTSQIREVKADLITGQLGRCLLCGQPIGMDSSTHLDHCHQTGHVRGALCRSCNCFEGIIHHKFVRSGLKGKGVDYIQWLQSLAKYLTEDYSDNDYHPQHMTDQTKLFEKLKVQDQKEHLKSLGIAFPEKATKKELSKIYKKSFLRMPRCDFDNGKYDT